ncbi:Amino acid transporter, transmembrane domain [Cinara cedri]|uniref:Amino acid transporter, transmembrane domain n=1 Tax=Cinara cedri TaxID=506608 RepID=A0A5E4N107_9HEMI|nr:Amino acid transporter, transmembrane domain [Cinara cedri]
MEDTIGANVYEGCDDFNINGNCSFSRGGSPHRYPRPKGAVKQLPPYDPFRMRNKTNTTTTIGALLHLMKSSVGSGILAMPNAFKNGGLIFGLFGMAAVGILCTHCIYILVVDAHISPEWHVSIRIWILGLAFPILPLGIVRTLRLLIPFSAIATICVLVGLGCTMTWMIIGVSPFASQRTVAAAVPLPDIGSLPWIAPVSHMPIFFTTVLFSMEGIGIILPIENSMHNPKHFLRGNPCGVLNAAMIIIVILYSVVGFLGYMRFGDAVKGSIALNLPNDLFAETVKIMIMLSIVFSYGLQFCVPSEIAWTHVEPWLRKRNWIAKHFIDNRKSSTLNLSTVVSSTVTTTTDVSLTNTKPVNKEESPKIVKEEEPIQFIDRAYYIMRSIMILITFIIAAIMPSLTPIISLFGAVFFSMLGLFCPAIIHLATFWEYDDEDSNDNDFENSNSDSNFYINHCENNINTVFDDPEDSAASNDAHREYRTTATIVDGSTNSKTGMSWFIVAKDALIVLLAIATLVSGTFSSVIDIITFFGFDSKILPVNTTEYYKCQEIH